KANRVPDTPSRRAAKNHESVTAVGTPPVSIRNARLSTWNQCPKRRRPVVNEFARLRAGMAPALLSGHAGHHLQEESAHAEHRNRAVGRDLGVDAVRDDGSLRGAARRSERPARSGQRGGLRSMGWLDASEYFMIETLEAERAEDLARSARLARTRPERDPAPRPSAGPRRSGPASPDRGGAPWPPSCCRGGG